MEKFAQYSKYLMLYIYKIWNNQQILVDFISNFSIIIPFILFSFAFFF